MTDVREGVFRPGVDLPLVTLGLARGARWITEYYPCEEVRRTAGEHWVVSMRVVDLAWAVRLVLGLGADVTVVGPPELAATVLAQTAAALASYEDDCGAVR